MGVTYGTKYITDGLEMRLDMYNTKSYPGSGTTWTCLMSGNTATFSNGASYDTDPGGTGIKAMVVDGVDDYCYINSPSTLSGQTQYTFSVWVNVLSNASYQRYFGSPSYGTYTLYNPANVAFHYNPYDSAYGSSTSIGSGYNMGYNNWTYICVTNDIPNTTVKIYINGELKNTGANVAHAFPGTISLGNQNGGQTLSNSATSEFAAWKRILSADEIRQTYEATRARYGVY